MPGEPTNSAIQCSMCCSRVRWIERVECPSGQKRIETAHCLDNLGTNCLFIKMHKEGETLDNSGKWCYCSWSPLFTYIDIFLHWTRSAIYENHGRLSESRVRTYNLYCVTNLFYAFFWCTHLFLLLCFYNFPEFRLHFHIEIVWIVNEISTIFVLSFLIKFYSSEFCDLVIVLNAFANCCFIYNDII